MKKSKTIILTGEPKSTQHVYASSCRGGFPSVYMKPTAKSIREAYMWEAKMQWRDGMLDVPFAVTLRFYHKTHRKQDIDNFNKLVLDACTGIIWRDDSLISEMHLYKYVDSESPRVELVVHIPG
jgi:Holliday junction resolvase RusA-like endonuclease